MKNNLRKYNVKIFQKDKTGHRSGYVEILKKYFKIEEISVKENSFIEKLRLVNLKDKLLFPTIDDSYLTFIFVSISRAVLKRETIGIFIRVEKCLKEKKGFFQSIKFTFFWFFKFVPKIHLVTITPHEVNNNYSKISHYGIWDFEFWDKSVNEPKQNIEITCQEFYQVSEGRKLLIAFIGRFEDIKGASEFLGILKVYSDMYKGIITGIIPANFQSMVSSVSNLTLVNRYVTDQEIEHVYSKADIIWCRYDESYDQMSGVFGRAVQYNKKVMIRRDSLISRFCIADKSNIDLPYNTIIATPILNSIKMRDDSLKTLEGILGDD